MMNSTNQSIKIRPNSTIRRAHTFVSNSQADFSYGSRPDDELFTNDFKSMSMSEMNADSSSKDFHREYEPIKSTSDPLLATEDEDGNVLPNAKGYTDQGSQVMFKELKLRKKKKNDQLKRTKSNLKRTKQNDGPQIPASTRLTSSTDLIASTKSSLSTIKTDENNSTKSLITVDTSKARSNLDVVRLCIRELGWKECSSNTNVDSDIYWHSSSFHEGNTNFAFNSGRVNKFPGMNDLLRKVHLTRLLNNMRLLFPNEYNFYPKTWFLPEQNQQFKDDVRYIHQLDRKHNRSLTTFIVKPSDGSQGEGIYLLRDPSHIILTNRPHVIQEYIERPLLINGLKFDLRIYVLLLNIHPLEIYLYEEGLVRFATTDYKAPNSDNLHQTYMHLTNYSLNKRSANYKHTVDENQTDGSKRKLSVVWKQLSHLFGSEKIERTKVLITELINKTILAFLPELRVEYEHELPSGKKRHISCFQIIGFDIILTDQLRPILLEINANPSLRIDFDKENEIGKIVYQPSLIDEEIKKPLILETLKLALPKKKLNTIARHAQLQADDEITAQYYEKIAQRRVEERNEKLKSARKTRFDIRLNPFFSRPIESIAKEVDRQQQEQHKIEQKKLQHTTPTHPILINQSNEPITAYTQFNNNPNSYRESKRSVQKPKQFRYFTGDDHESGPSNPITAKIELIKRANMRSGLARPISTMTDATMIRSIESLKLIYPSENKTRYQRLFLVDQIAYIYIQLVVNLGHKTMTGGQFRNFANICGIINETITAPSIDILYFQILKKWQQFVVRTTLTGLPFTAFVEAFFLLSQRKYPNASNLLESVAELVPICVRHLNITFDTPTSSLASSSTNHLPHRSAKNPTHSSLHIRPHISTLRSSTTLSIHRTATIPPPTDQVNPLATSTDDQTKPKLSRQSTKSVFPLFFDVL